MVKSHEDQFNSFISIAQSWGMNTELYPGLDKYFQDLNTQTAWMMYTKGYWSGVFDTDAERREKGIYYK